MPKPAKPPARHRKLRTVLIVIAVLLVAGIAAVLISRHQHTKAIVADRARFEQAARDVQSVADMVNAALPPEKSSVNKECVHQSAKFEPEPIICRVVYESLYGIDSLSTLNKIMSSIIQITQAQQQFRFEGMGRAPEGNKDPNIPNFPAAPSPNRKEVIGQVYLHKSSVLPCSLDLVAYNSDSPPLTGTYEVSTKPLSMHVSFNCGEEAKSAHYPIVE